MSFEFNHADEDQMHLYENEIRELQAKNKQLHLNITQYEHELADISRAIMKLNPAGRMKGIGYLDVKATLNEAFDSVLDRLDPEMHRNEIVNLREKFVAAKCAINTN